MMTALITQCFNYYMPTPMLPWPHGCGRLFGHAFAPRMPTLGARLAETWQIMLLHHLCLARIFSLCFASYSILKGWFQYIQSCSSYLRPAMQVSHVLLNAIPCKNGFHILNAVFHSIQNGSCLALFCVDFARMVTLLTRQRRPAAVEQWGALAWC